MHVFLRWNFQRPAIKKKIKLKFSHGEMVTRRFVHELHCVYRRIDADQLQCYMRVFMNMVYTMDILINVLKLKCSCPIKSHCMLYKTGTIKLAKEHIIILNSNQTLFSRIYLYLHLLMSLYLYLLLSLSYWIHVKKFHYF